MTPCISKQSANRFKKNKPSLNTLGGIFFFLIFYRSSLVKVKRQLLNGLYLILYMEKNETIKRFLSKIFKFSRNTHMLSFVSERVNVL